MTTAALPAAVTNWLLGDRTRDRTVERSPSGSSGRPFLIVPLVLVNAAAIWGQAGWAYEHIANGLVAAGHTRTGVLIALLFACAIESIGVYLAYEAHDALMADQASAMLRAGSYAVGGLAGLLNYWHFAETNKAQAIAFAGLSAVSPWLWTVWSRARNRTRLAELGMADTRGVKLSTTRKLWHPWRSLQVVSWAAWEGVTDPAEAVAGWEAHRNSRDPEPEDQHTEQREQREEKKAQPVDAAPTKGAQIDRLILEAWARGEEPDCSAIDKQVGASNNARGRKRNLAAKGWGPNKVPPEYKTDIAA